MDDLLHRLRVIWNTPLSNQAADEIERQGAAIADFEAAPGWREYREENKKLTEERDVLVATLRYLDKHKLWANYHAAEVIRAALEKKEDKG